MIINLNNNIPFKAIMIYVNNNNNNNNNKLVKFKNR